MNNIGWGSFDSLRSLASAPDDVRGTITARNDTQMRTVSEMATAQRGSGIFATISLRMAKGLGKVAAGFVLAGKQLRHG